MSQLLAWWDFEEEAASTKYAAHDGDPDHELDSGATSYISAANPKTGERHLSHDGSATQDVPAVGDATTFDFADSFSVTGWVRPAADIPANALDGRTILSKWKATSGERSYWMRYYSQAFEFEIRNKAGQSFEPSPDVAPVVGQYHFFAAYFDAENQVVGLQIDDQIDEVAFTGEIEQPVSSPFALYFIESGFGGWADDNIGDHDLDAVSVWSGALTATEREILRNGGAGWTYETFPGLTQTPEEEFAATYADASGRDPLPTMLVDGPSCQRAINTYARFWASVGDPLVVPVFVGLGKLSLVEQGQVIKVQSTRHAIGLEAGRAALVMRPRIEPRSGTCELTVQPNKEDLES